MAKRISRTKRSIQNSRMSFLLFLVQVFVGFYSRKIFLDYLGSEVLGLNTTLGNILSFMNLAELGIGIAMATSLYKPIHDEDQNTICEIITVQGILYRRIAIFLCIIGTIVLLCLPYLFPNTECGMAYVCVSFMVFLSGSLFSYIWNYKQILIGADQKNYKLLPWIHSVRLSKIGLQIVFLLFLQGGIWAWIILELIGNIANTLIINWIIKKEYPWLHSVKKQGNILIKQYHSLITKTKQLFIHKLAYFILEQTAPLIIYGFVSLTMVTYYSNYMILLGYSVTLIRVVFDGMGASIGNLVSENNKNHTLEVFWELFTSRIWISSIACFGLYLFVHPFIILWIGENYLLSNTTLSLMIIGIFIKMSRGVVDSFKDAYQLFGDVWAPAIEAATNLGFSILFGYLWGLNGILIGSNISLLLIVVFWKPYYLFKKGLKESCLKYFYQYLLQIIVILGCGFASYQLMEIFKPDNIYSQIACLCSCLVLYTICTFIIFLYLTNGMKKFTIRIKTILSTHL